MAIKNYVGIAEQATENWSMSFPAFPGTVTVGRNLAELYANAKDALATIVEAMLEDGESLPASFETNPDLASDFKASDYVNPRIVIVPVEVGGKAMRINVTMEESLVARVDSLAGRMQSSRSALLARGARMVLAADATD